MDFYNENKEFINKLTSISIFILVIVIVFKYLIVLFMPFIFGYCISLLLNPLVGALERKVRVNRGVASFITLVSFITIIIIGVFALGTAIGTYVTNLVKQVPNMEIVINQILMVADNIIISLTGILPDSIGVPLYNFIISMSENITSILLDYLKQMGISFAKSIPTLVGGTIIGLVSSFFFMNDKEIIKRKVKQYTPSIVKKYIGQTYKSSIFVLFGYLKTQMKLMSITFVITLISMFIIGYDYPFTVAISTGFIDAIPMFGSGFVLWPLSIYMIVIGKYINAVIIISTYIIITLTRQSLESKLLGSQISVHPLLVLIAMYVGLRIIGLFGLIIGPLLMIIIKQIFFAENIAENSKI